MIWHNICYGTFYGTHIIFSNYRYNKESNTILKRSSVKKCMKGKKMDKIIEITDPKEMEKFVKTNKDTSLCGNRRRGVYRYSEAANR